MILSFVAVLVVTTACGGVTSDDDDRLAIVASTTIIGDIVGQVVGDRADVEVLVPAGSDPHEFQPSARQVSMLQAADVVFVVGQGFEAGLADTLAAAADDGVFVAELGLQVDPLPFRWDADEPLTDEGLDPHFWMDPRRVGLAARLVGEVLSSLDDRVDWPASARAYRDVLEGLEDEMRSALEVVPPASRLLVTNHETLGYFADRFDFEILGAVVPGGSTLGDPSSAALAELVSAMRSRGVDVIFTESIESDALARSVAAEVGPDAEVVELFTGSLGDAGTGAETLVEMLRLDAMRIADALDR